VSAYKKNKTRRKIKKAVVAGLIGGIAVLAILAYVMSYLYEELNELLVSYNNAANEAEMRTMPRDIVEEDIFVAETPQAVIEQDRYSEYDGPFELPINGATGYASVAVDVKILPDASSETVKSLKPGAGFLILNEWGEWWEIETGGETGYVKHNLCMINLPDVVPSIRYNNTNTYNSRFSSSDYVIPGISGEPLYSGRAFNERLGKEEYIVAVMYAMSQKIYLAQQHALADGNGLVIYEGFRPLSVQQKIASELKVLAQINGEVDRGLNSPPWGISWFIATGVSNHQRGCSIDVGLVQPDLVYAVTGDYKYLTHAKAPLYFNMPSPIHELSSVSVTFARPVTIDANTDISSLALSDGMNENAAAQNLQKYCVSAGLMPLASEWWHFDDLQTRSGVPSNSVGDYFLTEIFSTAPE